MEYVHYNRMQKSTSNARHPLAEASCRVSSSRLEVRDNVTLCVASKEDFESSTHVTSRTVLQHNFEMILHHTQPC